MSEGGSRDHIFFTVSDLRTLRKLRDLNYKMLRETGPGEEDAITRCQFRYAAELCATTINKLEKALKEALE